MNSFIERWSRPKELLMLPNVINDFETLDEKECSKMDENENLFKAFNSS